MCRCKEDGKECGENEHTQRVQSGCVNSKRVKYGFNWEGKGKY